MPIMDQNAALNPENASKADPKQPLKFVEQQANMGS